jgi:hypothetical protein
MKFSTSEKVSPECIVALKIRYTNHKTIRATKGTSREIKKRESKEKKDVRR